MKYVKTFELYKESPQIGDYVLVNPKCTFVDVLLDDIDDDDDIVKSEKIKIKKQLVDFISNNFARISRLDISNVSPFELEIYYNNIPEDIWDYFDIDDDEGAYEFINYKDIISYDQRKKMLKIITKAKKYNIFD